MLSADSYVLPRSAAGLPAKSGTFLPKQTLNKQADRPPPLEGREKIRINLAKVQILALTSALGVVRGSLYAVG